MVLAEKTVLITGATGFLGGVLARRLANDGVQVKALARRPGRDRYIRDVEGIEIIMGDITDAQRMREVVQGCEVVFHLAVAASGPIDRQREVNVEGTRNVLQAAVDAGVGRVVYVSSIAAYGYRQGGDVAEDTPLKPGHDPYNVTKAEAEDVVREIGAQHGLDYSIIRPGMIYGPHSSAWTTRMFRIARRNPTIFVGDGSGSAYPVYVDDVVDMMVVLATHPVAVGEVFNCTPDPSPTWRAFLGGYSALVGNNRWLGIPPAPLKLIARGIAMFAPEYTRAKDFPALVSFLTSYRTYRMEKTHDLLGWQPKVELAEGIERCVPYLRDKELLD